jgi:hypothetical protein
MGYCPHRRKGHVSCGTRDGRTLPRRTRLDRHACSSSRTGVWRALDQTLACRPGQERRSWRPTRSLAREGGRGVMSRLSPPIGHFIGRVLRDTRHRLHRERRPYAGKVPVRGSPYATIWELNECSMSRSADRLRSSGEGPRAARPTTSGDHDAEVAAAQAPCAGACTSSTATCPPPPRHTPRPPVAPRPSPSATTWSAGPPALGPYRETDGEEGHDWQGTTVLLLTTTGRNSGAKRTTPLIYQRHGDDYLARIVR